MLLLLFPTKIIPPPYSQGLSHSFAVYDASAVLECKDTKKFVIKQVFVWFCVNLGGNLLLHYLTNYLIINTLVN